MPEPIDISLFVLCYDKAICTTRFKLELSQSEIIKIGDGFGFVVFLDDGSG